MRSTWSLEVGLYDSQKISSFFNSLFEHEEIVEVENEQRTSLTSLSAPALPAVQVVPEGRAVISAISITPLVDEITPIINVPNAANKVQPVSR